MVILVRLVFLVFLSFSFAVSSPELALAQQGSDGIDNDDDGQTDEADEYDYGSHDMGRMEAVCNATARTDACLFSHNMFCQYFSLPMSCALAQIGNNCNGGDPEQCRYYEGLMQANVACAVQGNQDACSWLQQQPVVYSFR